MTKADSKIIEFFERWSSNSRSLRTSEFIPGIKKLLLKLISHWETA